MKLLLFLSLSLLIFAGAFGQTEERGVRRRARCPLWNCWMTFLRNRYKRPVVSQGTTVTQSEVDNCRSAVASLHTCLTTTMASNKASVCSTCTRHNQMAFYLPMIDQGVGYIQNKNCPQICDADPVIKDCHDFCLDILRDKWASNLGLEDVDRISECMNCTRQTVMTCPYSNYLAWPSDKAEIWGIILTNESQGCILKKKPARGCGKIDPKDTRQACSEEYGDRVDAYYDCEYAAIKEVPDCVSMAQAVALMKASAKNKALETCAIKKQVEKFESECAAQ